MLKINSTLVLLVVILTTQLITEITSDLPPPTPFRRQRSFSSIPKEDKDPRLDGVWKTRTEWKAQWMKEWKAKKIYVAIWKKVWTPVIKKEWFPLPKPPPGWLPPHH